jgi:hypothetical protein
VSARHVTPEEWTKAAQRLEIMEQFKVLEEALKGFCRRVYGLLEKEMTVLLSNGPESSEENPIANENLLLELAYNTMIPNEDLEILVCSIHAGARAFVTEDVDILEQTALSLSPSHRMALVHPQNLSKSVGSELWLRWSPEQSQRPKP